MDPLLRSLRPVVRSALSSLAGVGLALVLAVTPAVAQETAGVQVRKPRLMLVPEATVNQTSAQQYAQLMKQAAAKGVLNRPPEAVERLRAVATRLIPQGSRFSAEAKGWRWEVNVIDANSVNAFCMPGGKIAFFYGILSKLQLDDDEVAAIMGHEVSHALLEHARERMGKTTATRLGVELGAAIFGLGNAGRMVGDLGSQLLTLKFSRDDESEADSLGLILAAKAGYNPRAGVTLWQKMLQASKGAPPQWLSTHPSGEARIREIESRLPGVQPIYAAAQKPPQKFGPPPKDSSSGTG